LFLLVLVLLVVLGLLWQVHKEKLAGPEKGFWQVQKRLKRKEEGEGLSELKKGEKKREKRHIGGTDDLGGG